MTAYNISIPCTKNTSKINYLSLDEKNMYGDDLLGFYDGFEGDYYEQDYLGDQV